MTSIADVLPVLLLLVLLLLLVPLFVLLLLVPPLEDEDEVENGTIGDINGYGIGGENETSSFLLDSTSSSPSSKNNAHDASTAVCVRNFAAPARP